MKIKNYNKIFIDIFNKMRIISHNMLMCNVKGCNKNNYHLKIIVNESKIINTEYNKEFIQKIVTKLNWEALVVTVKAFGIESFPK